MATSQNGWPVVDSTKVDNSPILGHKFPNGFLKGDVFRAFVWLFTQLDKRVEKISMGSPPDEWGWFVKRIEGTASISNHASATAGDYNASRHPMGEPASHGYSPTQINEIHTILREAMHIFRWGGDYTGRPDAMHFEIVGTPEQVREFILQIEGDTTMFPEKGDSGPAVSYWQNVLAMLDYTVGDIDGIYGPAFEKAVNEYRAKQGQGPNPGITPWHAAHMTRALGRS